MTDKAFVKEAQPLTEMKLLMITTAYEQGVGKGIQRRNANPYADGTDEYRAWAIGYEEGLDKPTAPAAQPDYRAEFVRVIEFAIKQGIEASEFLDAWLHGDTSEWPEFAQAAQQGEQ